MKVVNFGGSSLPAQNSFGKSAISSALTRAEDMWCPLHPGKRFPQTRKSPICLSVLPGGEGRSGFNRCSFRDQEPLSEICGLELSISLKRISAL